MDLFQLRGVKPMQSVNSKHIMIKRVPTVTFFWSK